MFPLLFSLATLVASSPQRLIVDTDMGFDVDDVVAVCLANSLHMNGLVDLVGVVHNTGCHLGIGGVSSIQHWYGHDNVTLGAWKGNFGSDCNQHYNGALGQNQYLSKLTAKMPGPVTDSSQVSTGVDAYRRVLAQQPNGTVNIASIGMPTNLADLLISPPDDHSPLSGYDLIAAKVAKIVFMDGGYNFGCAANFIGPADECYGSAQKALKMPPNVRLVISNKGENPDIYTGSGVQQAHPADSPCREALKNWCCNPNGKPGATGRLSWDPITVMIASLDVSSVFEKETDYGTQITADPNGKEHFFGNGTKNALTDFVDRSTSPDNIRKAIDFYVNQVPNLPPTPPTPPKPVTHWGHGYGFNCWPGHGADDIDPPSGASHGSVDDCKDSCLAYDGCDAITTQKENDGTYSCWRKKNIRVDLCDKGTNFDTWVVNGAAMGYNCYPGHGADDIDPPSGALHDDVDACAASCRSYNGCGGMTLTKGSDGKYVCWRKENINFGNCDTGTEFSTYSVN